MCEIMNKLDGNVSVEAGVHLQIGLKRMFSVAKEVVKVFVNSPRKKKTKDPLKESPVKPPDIQGAAVESRPTGSHISIREERDLDGLQNTK